MGLNAEALHYAKSDSKDENMDTDDPLMAQSEPLQHDDIYDFPEMDLSNLSSHIQKPETTTTRGGPQVKAEEASNIVDAEAEEEAQAALSGESCLAMSSQCRFRRPEPGKGRS